MKLFKFLFSERKTLNNFNTMIQRSEIKKADMLN